MSNRLAAEFIGTFWLVLGGCGSAVLAGAFLISGERSDAAGIEGPAGASSLAKPG